MGGGLVAVLASLTAVGQTVGPFSASHLSTTKNFHPTVVNGIRSVTVQISMADQFSAIYLGHFVLCLKSKYAFATASFPDYPMLCVTPHEPLMW